MNAIVAILIALAIALIAGWAVRVAGRELGIPPGIQKVLLAIIAVIFIIWLLSALGGLPTWGPVR
jgi:hypothetical protein